MRLSENFTLEEFTDTNYLVKNVPGQNEVDNLKALVKNILQPTRNEVGYIEITSGYRSKALNKRVKGSANSQHMLGQAGDFKCSNNARAFYYIKENLPFDQLIWEYGDEEQPEWVHVSFGPRNRREVIIIKK